MTSYFYSHVDKNSKNATFIERLEKYADRQKKLVYVLVSPLTDQKYTYSYKNALIVLSPKNKVAIIDYGNNKEAFRDYVEDIIEDIGSISDKYQYKDIVDRPRKWRTALFNTNFAIDDISNIEDLFGNLELLDELEQKKLDLLISCNCLGTVVDS